jgi:hypothetical protein
MRSWPSPTETPPMAVPSKSSSAICAAARRRRSSNRPPCTMPKSDWCSASDASRQRRAQRAVRSTLAST